MHSIIQAIAQTSFFHYLKAFDIKENPFFFVDVLLHGEQLQRNHKEYFPS